MAVTTRKLHKWISVGTGVFLFSWVVTGLIMIGTQYLNGPTQGQGTPGVSIAWPSVAVAPARAAEVAVAAAPAGASVNRLDLVRLRDGAAYLVRLVPARQFLVDAATGSLITITPELASGIAADRMPGTAVRSVEHFDRHGPGYRRGPLPVYRVTFDDEGGTLALVNAETGEVSRDTRRLRVLRSIGGWHEFVPLEPYGKTVRHGALWVTSLVAVFGILTGYWLSLPAGWQRRAAAWGRRPETPPGS